MTPRALVPALLLACVLPLASGPARARPRAVVVEAGEITAAASRPAPDVDRDHSLTERQLLDGIRFTSRSDTLDALLCFRFGVLLRVSADPGEALPPELTVVVRHPRLTRPDGATGTEDSFPTPLDGDSAYAGFSFDHPWEMREGDWTFVFLAGDTELVSHTFHVSVSRPPGSMCPGKPVS